MQQDEEKTKKDMAGWCVHGPDKDGCKRMERQSKEWRGLEAYCRGGQGPPRAVAPSGRNLFLSDYLVIYYLVYYYYFSLLLYLLLLFIILLYLVYYYIYYFSLLLFIII